MRLFITLCILVVGPHLLLATHNRTGYIRYEQTGELTVRAEIVTLTDIDVGPADRDSLTICWGDGQTSRIARSNGDGEQLENGFRRNTYLGDHTYAEKGEYIICLTDPTRSAGILNINPPESVEIIFHIQTTVKLLDLALMGANQSPAITHEPNQLAFVDNPYVYDPQVIDVDGDSIAFELITPMEGLNDPVPNYSLPNEVGSNIGSTFTLDEHTGILTWDAPAMEGKYNIAILISSFRNGERIDAMVLDMEILVLAEDVTGVDQLNRPADLIKIYPNPGTGQWTRVETQLLNPKLLYVIFSASGRRLKEGVLSDAVSLLNLEDIPSGTYYLSVRSAQFIATKPFLLVGN